MGSAGLHELRSLEKEGTCPRYLWLDVIRSTGLSLPESYGQIHRASWDQDFYYSRRWGIYRLLLKSKVQEEASASSLFPALTLNQMQTVFPLLSSHMTPSRSPSFRELSLQLPSSLLPAKKLNKDELLGVDWENLYWYLIQNGISSALRISVLVLWCTGDITNH